jgi:hypothetical protein
MAPQIGAENQKKQGVRLLDSEFLGFEYPRP